MSTATLPRIGSPELCSRCDQTVVRARTLSGKVILMDFHPTQLGPFVIVKEDPEGRAVVARVAARLAPDDDRSRYSCHWNRCRGGASSRRVRYGRPELNLSPFA